MNDVGWATSPGVRSRMLRQRSRDTGPEVALRRALHRRGVRFRLHRPIVPGTRRKVDIAIVSARVAIDVRGCFWHGHEHDQLKYRRSKNLDYWQPKIAGNQERDADTAARLEAAGWHVVVVWECEDVNTAAESISAIVRSRKAERDP